MFLYVFMGGLFYFYVLFIYHVPYCKRRRFLNKVLNYLGEMDIGATRPVPGKSQAFFFKKGGGIVSCHTIVLRHQTMAYDLPRE
jgi:hypothetical protein